MLLVAGNILLQATCCRYRLPLPTCCPSVNTALWVRSLLLEGTECYNATILVHVVCTGCIKTINDNNMLQHFIFSILLFLVSFMEISVLLRRMLGCGVSMLVMLSMFGIKSDSTNKQVI